MQSPTKYRPATQRICRLRWLCLCAGELCSTERSGCSRAQLRSLEEEESNAERLGACPECGHMTLPAARSESLLQLDASLENLEAAGRTSPCLIDIDLPMPSPVKSVKSFLHLLSSSVSHSHVNFIVHVPLSTSCSIALRGNPTTSGFQHSRRCSYPALRLLRPSIRMRRFVPRTHAEAPSCLGAPSAGLRPQ